MTERCGRLRLMVLAAIALLALLPAVAPPAGAQEAAVRLEVPPGPIAVDAPPFTVPLVVDNVENLGAFDFDLTYDPKVLRFVEVVEGPFLGSSGREVRCLPPTTTDSSVVFLCVTLGATPDGPNGSGLLANLTFEPVGEGSSPLHFARLTLTNPPAEELPAVVEDATVTVGSGGDSGGGINWALWGTAIALAAAVMVGGGLLAWWRTRL